MPAISMGQVADHHTLRGRFKLASGKMAETYIDLRSALLCPACSESLVMWYVTKLREVGPATPIVTGAFGGLLAGRLLSLGTLAVLWNPKDHGGIEWSGLANLTERAVLLDDVRATGRTLTALREAVSELRVKVVGRVTALPAEVVTY